MSLPVFDLTRGFPTDLRELGRLFSPLNIGVRRNGVRTFCGDQRFLNQISSGGKRSTQSVQPLSSTDSGGGLAEVAVASHDLHFGFGQVGYSAGTITGLANNTLYYIYADDENYEGGAVTYLATTNPNLVTDGSNRYYLGKITTAAGGGGGTGGGYGGGGGGGGNPLP